MNGQVLDFPAEPRDRGLSSPHDDLTRAIIDIALSDRDIAARADAIEDLVFKSKLGMGVRMSALACASVFLGTELLRKQ